MLVLKYCPACRCAYVRIYGCFIMLVYRVWRFRKALTLRLAARFEKAEAEIARIAAVAYRIHLT